MVSYRVHTTSLRGAYAPTYESLSYAGICSTKEKLRRRYVAGVQRRWEAGPSPEAAHKLNVHAVAEDKGVGGRNLRPIDNHPDAVSLLGRMA